MARMHSRKKGKAGSKRPMNRTKKSWIRYKPKEVELLIVKLAKEEKIPSQIGIFLRDTYGIPDIKYLVKKSILQILKEKNLVSEIPEDLSALIKRSIMIRKHLKKNSKDMTAKHGLNLTESKIKRLVKYYKKTKKLPQDWTYSPESIKLMVE